MPNEELPAEACKMKAVIDAELSKLVNSFEPMLAPQAKYALLSEGKRLRPLIVLLSAQSVGGDWKKAVSLALTFELIHTSSLIHDDIIDKEKLRRGRRALYSNWSVNSAILTGDFLIAYAVYLSSGYGERILKLISESAIELCRGEYMDLTLKLASTEKEYFQMIESKSASLFKAAASCGALVGSSSPKELECLSNFGKNFGMAYQLRDDLLDLKPRKGQSSQDLKKGQVTLPLIHLCGISNSAEKKAIDKLLHMATTRDTAMSSAAIKDALKRLEEAGSIAYCKKKLSEYCRMTVASLAPLEESPYKDALIQMSKSLKRSTLKD